MRITFASYAFGCRVNEAEKIQINRKLFEQGLKYSDYNPDFYIINSCAVTQKAEREVKQFIYQTRKRFPKTKIIVTGCAATFWMKNKQIIKDIDLLIPNHEKDLLFEKLKALHVSLRAKSDLAWQSSQKDFNDKFLDSGRLVIKIQDGCGRYCSYCLVPYLRGKPKSKTISEILVEISQFKNIQEVILSDINTEYFGKENNESLTELIDTIISKTSIPRISFGSIHPWSVTHEFINYYKKIQPLNLLVNYFHIPLQSGSDKILKLMNRKYTSHQFIDKLEKIKQINPHAFISTDIIVGFPGETEAEFKETYEFLRVSPIDKFHVFRFSRRLGTTAEILVKQYGEPANLEKQIRSAKLRKLSQKKFIKFQKSLIERTATALIINQDNALFSNNLLVKVSDLKSSNKRIINVKIKKFNKYLFGAVEGI